MVDSWATMARFPIVLNVYDMYWLNDYTSSIGLGVYHSGIEVHGREYAFGGHPFPFTGIFDMDPKDLVELGEGFRFKETIAIGFTDFSASDIDLILENLGRKYTGLSYHLIKNNCNHFTSAFAKILSGKDIPKWVNRLASIGGRFPFLCACIPKEWLAPEPMHAVSEQDLLEWVNIDGPVTDEDDCLMEGTETSKRTVFRVSKSTLNKAN